jgi:NAD(P)-dependent dehydrogenase (short-subunit alcohol dehydrogenase family)
MKAAKLFDVSGLNTVVTGAASGLGLAMAEALADNGARVTLIDRDAVGLGRAAARLKLAGGDVHTAALDVADRGALREAIDAAGRSVGKLDVVFANAGMSAGPGYLTEEGQLANVQPDTWQRVLDVNLTSVFNTLQFAANHMKPQKSGRIIVTASIAGLRAETPCGYGYTATKAAIINLVRQAAMELASYNVLVNAIAPGPFMTNIAGGRLHRDPEAVKMFENMVPLGRIASTDEIQGLALYLASPASSFVTGTVIPIDGGCTAG